MRLILLLLLAIGAATTLGAQHPREVPDADLAFIGLLGGALACLPAGALGATALHLAYPRDEYSGLGGAVLGCWAGATVGYAAGVHLGNHRRGRFLPTLSAAVGAVVLGAAILSVMDAPANAWIVIPFAQITLPVYVQRQTERQRARSL